MAEKEEPIASDETGKIKVKAKANKEKQPDGNQTEGNVTKVAAKMKKPAEVIEQTITKVDLNKPVEETKVEEVVEETKPEEASETPVLQEITEEQAVVEEIAEQAEEAIVKAEVTGEPLPENIQKLVSFMDETGGDLNDYVKLNQDYSEMDNQDLLQEYYKQTKPHLNNEEINFLMEDNFSFDEDVDDDREIRRKKLALKEQVASAKSHLDGQKSKYYEDIKMGSKLTSEQQEAINFFNRYNEEEAERQETLERNTSTFLNKTDNVFNDKFEGFEYTVGDKKFRYSVKDANKVKETQSDINNFVKKFLNKNNAMEDAGGYHKSLFTAMNADAIINHFYEQGKADAMRDSVANAKNVNMSPRQSHGEVAAGGIKARVLGDSSSDFKFKIKNNKFKK
jgi:hypothetical protein